jgi:acetolactate synthase I/II/III large subunit
VARQERPGPVHLELPEGIAGEETGGQSSTVAPHPIHIPLAAKLSCTRGYGEVTSYGKVARQMTTQKPFMTVILTFEDEDGRTSYTSRMRHSRRPRNT